MGLEVLEAMRGHEEDGVEPGASKAADDEVDPHTIKP